MSVTLIDARYYGHAMKRARRELKLDSVHAAKLLKISHQEYKKFERGRTVIPENIYVRLIHAGFSLLAFKRRQTNK